MYNSTLGLRPDESPTLQALGEQTQTVAIPPKKFYDIPSPAAKHEHMSGERLLMQHVLNLRTQSIKTAAQIRHSCCNPDLGPHRKLDHWRRLSRIERNRTGSAPLSTLSRALPGSSMWIAPLADVATSSDSRLSSAGLVTVTGISAAQGSLSSPRSNARRHPGHARPRLERQLHYRQLL